MRLAWAYCPSLVGTAICQVLLPLSWKGVAASRAFCPWLSTPIATNKLPVRVGLGNVTVTKLSVAALATCAEADWRTAIEDTDARSGRGVERGGRRAPGGAGGPARRETRQRGRAGTVRGDTGDRIAVGDGPGPGRTQDRQ